VEIFGKENTKVHKVPDKRNCSLEVVNFQGWYRKSGTKQEENYS
jgi:hypothetical protein